MMKVEIETMLILPRLEKVQRSVKSPEVAKVIIEVKEYVNAQMKLRQQDNDEIAKLFRKENV